jgi:hypothetical protein
MSKNLKSLVTLVFCSLVILSWLLYARTCFADMPNPGPRKHDVEIEGAKIISEGGYLWFHVINHGSQVYVAVHFPSDVMVIGNASFVVSLGTNESADFHFQVPYYWSGWPVFLQQGPTKGLRFYFELYNLYRGTKIGTENTEFDVNVVPLNGRVNNQDLFYLAVFAAAAVVTTVIVIAVRVGRKEKQP